MFRPATACPFVPARVNGFNSSSNWMEEAETSESDSGEGRCSRTVGTPVTNRRVTAAPMHSGSGTGIGTTAAPHNPNWKDTR